MTRVALLLLLLLAVLCGCVAPASSDAGSEDAGASDAGVDAGTAADAGALSDGGLADEVRFLSACSTLPHDCAARDAGAPCGQCQVRLVYDPRRCTAAQPCDRLLVLWAAMDCASDEAGAQLRATADRPGWLAACVQPLFPGEMLPTTLGAPQRDQQSLDVVFATLRTERGVWTGKDALMVGCSAGATRYPVVAARLPDDAQWLASRTNAACFSEGVFSLPAQDRFIGEGLLDGGPSCAARHRRMAEAFTTVTPRPGHGCTSSPGAQCACDPGHAVRSWPGACATGDCLSFESFMNESGSSLVAGVGPADFSIPHWKLVSEGSSFTDGPDRCLKDVVPEAPLEGLCTALDADPAHDCVFVRRPEAPHCSAFWSSFQVECLDWFEQLP
jgi:hypothetical protein